MITFTPTPYGAGVRLWGTQNELRQFYDTLQRYWSPELEAADPIELQRDNILASFCYDNRHAYKNDAAFNTQGYNDMLKHLMKEAKRLDCGIGELTYD